MFVIKFKIACNPLLFYRTMKVRTYETIILRGDLYGCYMSSLTWMRVNLTATCLVSPNCFVIWRVIWVNSSPWTWQELGRLQFHILPSVVRILQSFWQAGRVARVGGPGIDLHDFVLTFVGKHSVGLPWIRWEDTLICIMLWGREVDITGSGSSIISVKSLCNK
jgi:hypothetical protein